MTFFVARARGQTALVRSLACTRTIKSFVMAAARCASDDAKLKVFFALLILSRAACQNRHLFFYLRASRAHLIAFSDCRIATAKRTIKNRR